MRRTCVYLVNEHPFYMFEVANSVQMLRRHNSAIPIVLIFIQDNARETLIRKNLVSVNYESSKFLSLMDHYGVEVLKKEPFQIPGEEGFFFINRTYLKDIEADHIFHIDADTFIFGDIEPLFDKYQDFDFAASKSNWMLSTPTWTNDYIGGIDPFNSGVMFWKKDYLHDWAGKLTQYSKYLREKTHPGSKWLYEVNPKATNREELSVSIYVSEYGLKYKYIDKGDCYVVERQEDLNRFDSLILHTFTDQWVEVYKNLNKAPKKKISKRVIFK